MELFIEQATILDKASRTLTQDDKALLVKFKLMSAETENANARVYPAAVLRKAVEDLKARLAKKKASFAMNKHKDDENVDDVAAVLDDVTMEGNDVFAVAKILPTQRGKNVQAILRHGGAVGVLGKVLRSGEGWHRSSGRRAQGFRLLPRPWLRDFRRQEQHY